MSVPTLSANFYARDPIPIISSAGEQAAVALSSRDGVSEP
jgi:hypothetical protein